MSGLRGKAKVVNAVNTDASAAAEKEEEDQVQGEEQEEEQAESTDSTAKSTDSAPAAPASTLNVTATGDQVKTEPNVRVKTNQDLRTFVGTKWYNFKQGVEQSVPASVKEKLREANLLEAL